uniref:Uncharacterized protein n=1 Tax=Arundo donax TaxID=35708 RepID=A0A0A9H0T0_ARUDO
MIIDDMFQGLNIRIVLKTYLATTKFNKSLKANELTNHWHKQKEKKRTTEILNKT